MEKYLFSDGTNLMREVQSGAELQAFINNASDANSIRIWVFKSSEWLNYKEFLQRNVPVVPVPPMPPGPGAEAIPKREPAKPTTLPKKKTRSAAIIKFMTVTATVITILLVYNFSRVKWHTAASMQITAPRPQNMPLHDMDSLVKVIESTRAQKIDKVTLTNLRLRNTWPDRLELTLKSDRDTSQHGTKFHNIQVTIDNSTGYNVDNAVVEIRDWRNGFTNSIDTLHFNNVGYAALSTRVLPVEYFGDSLSVSFLSLRAPAFNFCYTADKESNYGNLNDRWFCRD